MPLAERIAQAAIAVGGGLRPDKRNKEKGYDYISADQILHVCGKALANVGVVVIPSITSDSVVVSEVKANTASGMLTRYDAHIIFEMIVSDGEDEARIPWVGHGCDFSLPDKAIYKAITSGHRYFLAKLLNVGVGNEDSEHDPASPGVPAKPTWVTLEEALKMLTPKGKRFEELSDEQLNQLISFPSLDEVKKAGARMVLESRHNGVQQS